MHPVHQARSINKHRSLWLDRTDDSHQHEITEGMFHLLYNESFLVAMSLFCHWTGWVDQPGWWTGLQVGCRASYPTCVHHITVLYSASGYRVDLATKQWPLEKTQKENIKIPRCYYDLKPILNCIPRWRLSIIYPMKRTIFYKHELWNPGLIVIPLSNTNTILLQWNNKLCSIC